MARLIVDWLLLGGLLLMSAVVLIWIAEGLTAQLRGKRERQDDNDT